MIHQVRPGVFSAGQRCRGDGTTTGQMLAAAPGAYFVSAHKSAADYDRGVAHRLGREDLHIVTLPWLFDARFLGVEMPQLVIDHHAWYVATARPDEFYRALEYAATYVGRRAVEKSTLSRITRTSHPTTTK